MVNTSIAVNAWPGEDMVGSNLNCGSIHARANGGTVTLIGSCYTDANTIYRGRIKVLVDAGITGGNDEVYGILSVGVSGAEAFHTSIKYSSNDDPVVTPVVQKTFYIQGLDSTEKIGILFTGSIVDGDGTNDTEIKCNSLQAVTY